MNKDLESKLDKIISLCKTHYVSKLSVFGSAVSGSFNENSDIDLLITFEGAPIETYADNYFNLKDELEKMIGKEVDLVTEKTLSNPYLIKTIYKSIRHIYG